MSVTIHKFVVDKPVTAIDTHLGARFVHVAAQHGHVTVWAEVDTSRPPAQANLTAIVTGGNVPAGGAYLGTAHLEGFIFHVYLVDVRRP